ncbi:MAG: hypothetical protein PHF37_07460 [Phycisphaerae bacterium]|nr:hypothetical protein [Phycisphaerae bacterium]
MKAEHRHELKTNELAQWLANFPEWAKNNLKTIIYVAVVVILVAAAYVWNSYQKNVLTSQRQTNFTNLARGIERQTPQILQASSQGQDLSYILLQSGDQLKNTTKDTKNADMAAFALIKEGQAIRMELHYRLQIPSEDDKIQQLNSAKEAYMQASDKTKNSQLLSQARFGLGLCEEELGNFQQAREIYSKITESSEFDGLIAKDLAKKRLTVLKDYEQPIFFKPAPVMPQLQLEDQLQSIEPMFGPLIQPEGQQAPETNQPTP